MIENKLTDIFTEIDESIFSDGSIDPMGLRIIWTSLGNRIFGNRLNTISTDIRFYTINLFHHYIIFQCLEKFEDKIINKTGFPPYNNRVDLYNGIIIFLECLLTHSVLKFADIANDNENSSVPGISKLKGLSFNKPNDARVKYLIVDQKSGILIRHILLGIHGRHKGPFQQMGIFDKYEYYNNKLVWEESKLLFSKSPWKELADSLIDIIYNNILNTKNQHSTFIKVLVSEILTDELIKKYKNIINNYVYKEKECVTFWEKRLKLLDGPSGILYNLIKNMDDNISYEGILKNATKVNTKENVDFICSICAIEPFLTCIEKVIYRLLKRGTNQIDSDLEGFIYKWLNETTISTDTISKYLKKEFIDEEALNRLKKLLLIYGDCKNLQNSILFAHKLIIFHKELMNDRNNLPWISMGSNNNITLHRSFNFNKDYENFLNNNNWINNYYLVTLKSLYQGLHN